MNYNETNELADNDMVYFGYYYLINGNPERFYREGNAGFIKEKYGIQSIRKCNVVARGFMEGDYYDRAK